MQCGERLRVGWTRPHDPLCNIDRESFSPIPAPTSVFPSRVTQTAPSIRPETKLVAGSAFTANSTITTNLDAFPVGRVPLIYSLVNL
jgi:hypothetical protein